MLIVKNLFSFYVEFEILVYFLLFCRLCNVNKDVNMRNDAWNEMDWTYMKKSSEKYFWTRIVDPQLSKLRTTIMRFSHSFALLRKCKNCGPQLLGLEARTCGFKTVFSWELRDFNTPSSQRSLNWLENRSQARKKRKNTIEEEFEEG
jgi:hypothetical protein